MADTTTAIRVIPSGKIYRQMFDAQVQLNKSLTQISKRSKSPIHTVLSSSNGVPLVRLNTDETHHGVLTERQKTWVNGFPNEQNIENPVLYKQYAEYINSKLIETDALKYDKEVEGLPDVVVPGKVGSNIIDRIASSRKERHEAAVEDMQQELNVISSNFEPRIAETSEMILNKLNKNDEELENILARIKLDEDLIDHRLEDLDCLWQEVQSFTPSRQGWIIELDFMLKTLEDERAEMIRTVFEVYSDKLEKISHLMAPDLQKFLDKEAQLVNQTILSNRRAYADLYVRLMSADIEREKTLYAAWKRRKQDWSNLKNKKFVNEFKEYMKSDEVTKPEGVDRVLQEMIAAQCELNEKRYELIMSLAEMKPPMSTKTAVYKWNQTVQSVSQEIENINQMYLSKLHEEYEQVCHGCIDKMNSIKETVIIEGVCTSSQAQDVIDKDMLPLIGDRQKSFEENLEIMENALETHGLTMTTDVKSLFKFAQGATHVWDIHEIGLAKQERALQEKLERCRHDHDYKNQDTEAMLDNIMDKMRQESTEQGLASSLVKALEMLERIRLSYEVFHQKQTEIVKMYPEMVKSELDSYDESVCKFFMVNRKHPDDMVDSGESDGRDSRSSVSSPDEKERKRTPTKQKRQSKEESRQDQSPLPMAVSEVLSTEKGTTFYVLTVAGKHGVQPEPVTPSEDGHPPSAPEKPKKNYIASIDISKTFINDVKRQLRVNFLNHLETWLDQALTRSNSVVVAKCEELNSEFDLRLHLHQPRSRRAELDIHNVRAAELMMHSERVTRHSKGIQQSLTDLRTRFSAMSQEHNKLASKFRVEIEALEIVFINATKSSRLMALQNELSVKLEEFMSVIRTSLRQFRQHLDKNLQMLRESNARFIKSFKMFSDGGNFCPDEIEEYRKKLEKMSQKIDQVEGSIMSDLEGMESKRLEQGTKVASEFEDRFKSHMFDLTFMEKIARWLTNTQVKIKAEVAESNSQAQKLSQFLQRLERRIDACENPNPDKEQITSDELYNSLPEVFEAVAERTEYLNCVKGVALSAPRPSSGSILQGNPVAAARVGFISDVTPVSKAGKQPVEDPSLGVIKSILKGQPSKSKSGLEFDYDEDLQPQQGASNTQATTPGLPPDSREKLKSAMSQSSGKGSISSDKSKPVSRRSQIISVESGQQKRLGSAAAPVPFEKKQLVLPLPKISGAPTESKSASNINSIRNQKPVKFDRKYLVFGDSNEEVDGEYFTGIVRKILRDALDGLLTTADLFYKTKGNRSVTRPQALQENFDGCADAVVQKLQSYFKQSLEYHNDCLQEFRKQLSDLERLVSRVPDLVINDVEKSQINTVQVDRKNIDDKYSPLLLNLRQQQNEHQNSLRPTLGHPHQRDKLLALCEKENKRHEEYLELVEKHSQELQNCVVEHSEKFIEVLSRTAENQLLQLDNQIVVDEIKKGRVAASRYPTSELLRRKAAGENLEDGEEIATFPRGRGTWIGLPINEMKVKAKISEDTPELTATVTTLKTTLAHQAVIMAREQAFENYKKEFYKSLQDIYQAKDLLIKAEERWTDSWKRSVQKVEELY